MLTSSIVMKRRRSVMISADVGVSSQVSIVAILNVHTIIEFRARVVIRRTIDPHDLVWINLWINQRTISYHASRNSQTTSCNCQPLQWFHDKYTTFKNKYIRLRDYKKIIDEFFSLFFILRNRTWAPSLRIILKNWDL